MVDNISIANAALASFGSTPIQSFDDSSPSGAAIAIYYPLVMTSLLGEYPWSFCKMTVPLQKLAVAGLSDGMNAAGWANAFALPGNMLANPEKISSSNRCPDAPDTRYEIQGTTVFSNAPALWALGQFQVDESAWPPTFVKAAVDCLAAEIYPMITGNGNQLGPLQVKAWGQPTENRMGGSLGMAKRTDARNNPSRVLGHSPLIDARGAMVSVIPTGALFP